MGFTQAATGIDAMLSIKCEREEGLAPDRLKVWGSYKPSAVVAVGLMLPALDAPPSPTVTGLPTLLTGT